jgi:CheY-like chemotaxis protein
VTAHRVAEALRFLLVEDDPLYATLVGRAFQIAGVAVPLEKAADGAEALQLLRADPDRVRVVLLDVNMPGLSGHEVLAALRGDDQLRTTPVVMLTSSRQDKDIDGAYRAGANAYIVKPADLNGLRDLASTLQQFWSSVQLPRS